MQGLEGVKPREGEHLQPYSSFANRFALPVAAEKGSMAFTRRYRPTRPMAASASRSSGRSGSSALQLSWRYKAGCKRQPIEGMGPRASSTWVPGLWLVPGDRHGGHGGAAGRQEQRGEGTPGWGLVPIARETGGG